MVYVQIQWTTESLQEAKTIARALLEKRLIACANILPEVQSLYLWKGKIEESTEVKVFFKTTDSLFLKVRDYILEHASYDVPEISKIEITGANPAYTTWLQESVTQSAN
ncbi:MAG: Divalent-cation tolerance protein CutA [Chlamydiae bacterium]|nr:Divalent-cation tolerance protein CutA [Chlamydiota bacterium]